MHVEPFFVAEQSNPEEDCWVFGYSVVVENAGTETVQLKSRYWRIVDGYGRKIEVRGEGVVGKQPVLAPGERYKYTSGTPLKTSSGIMSGTYQMETAEGRWFDVQIPAFSLDAPDNQTTKH